MGDVRGRSFGPLLSILRLYGFDFRNDFRCLRFVQVTITTVLAFLLLALYVSHTVLRYNENLGNIQQVTTFVKTSSWYATVCLTLSNLCLRRHKFRSLVRRLQEELGGDLTVLGRWISGSLAVALVYNFGTLVYILANVRPQLTSAIFLAHVVFFFVVGPVLFVVVIFQVAICVVLRHNLLQLSSSSAPSTTVAVRHQTICQVVDEANHVHQELTLVSAWSQLSFMLFQLRSMNLNLRNVPVHEFVFCVVIVVVFCLVNVSAGLLNAEVRTSLKSLRRTQRRGGTVYAFEPQLQPNGSGAKVELYVHQVLTKPPAMTGWNLYTASTSTIFTAATNILSYVLVLYSITQQTANLDRELGEDLAANVTEIQSWTDRSPF